MLLALPLLVLSQAIPNPTVKIGNHVASFNRAGLLRPWTSLGDAIDREMEWYRKCPVDNGYARCVTVTFLDGKFGRIADRKDAIPAMQSATGILSYLGYYKWKGRKPAWVLDRARQFADYILIHSSTPDTGAWPRFPRSTGRAGEVPQREDCGCQADRPFEVQPDKGALFGYALIQLYQETKEPRYLAAAKNIGSLLANRMTDGDEKHSPWPFRVDFRTGAGRGDVSADMGYPLSLFDGLEELGMNEFSGPKARLLAWFKKYQLPSARKDGKLWVNFFEDYELEGNRNSWSPLSCARLLLQRKSRLDPDWLSDARVLIDFATQNFVSVCNGVTVCGEQDDDKDPWGGALSTYGCTLAIYAKTTDNRAYLGLARQALFFAGYAIDDDGCPGQTAKYAVRGGWQEDAHTDVVHNIVDAFEAFPELAKER